MNEQLFRASLQEHKNDHRRLCDKVDTLKNDLLKEFVDLKVEVALLKQNASRWGMVAGAVTSGVVSIVVGFALRLLP